MKPRPDACRGCPADTIAHGFVPPSGPTDATLAIVGQGPGRDEAAFGEPFIGESGRMLSQWCVRADVPRDKCAIANVVWCQLPKNRAPKVAEAQHCWKAHVLPWLEQLHNVRVVAAVGVPAMQVFLGRKASASIAGTVHVVEAWSGEAYARKGHDVRPVQADIGGAASDMREMCGGDAATDQPPPAGSVGNGDGAGAVVAGGHVRNRSVVIAPILHPAGIMRGQFALGPIQADFLRSAWRIANDPNPYVPTDVTQPPAGAIPTPTLDDLRAYLMSTMPTDVLACDIEGTHGRLIGVGFARVRDEATLYIPLLDADRPYWSDDDWPAADETLRCLLRHPLVFHNGQAFDVPFLESCGYVVEQYVDDTMIRHHTLYAEQPKALEELAIRYLGFPSWKWLSSVESGEQK